ncbi:MAG: transglutaminase family protein [archaeon GB-1867-005]|nr:transglutaminase family protein [Candidatus Culexmicrobium cathedralense]
MWVPKEPPAVPSLEKYPSSMAKRFTDVCITHLLVHRQTWIRRKMEELNIRTARDAVEFVIRRIDYPLTWGHPDDKHLWNAFSGKACYQISMDYWQTAYETLMTFVLNNKLHGKNGYGDCEDTSILTASMLRLLSVPCYVVLGMVYRDGIPLGGHGWVIAEFPDKKWRLVETTLDEPPTWYSGYPTINPEENRWRVGNIVYEGWVRFNEKEYYEWGNGNMFEKYVKMGFREKETVRKHKAISEAFKTRTKALRHRRLLGRLRWR